MLTRAAPRSRSNPRVSNKELRIRSFASLYNTSRCLWCKNNNTSSSNTSRRLAIIRPSAPKCPAAKSHKLRPKSQSSTSLTTMVASNRCSTRSRSARHPPAKFKRNRNKSTTRASPASPASLSQLSSHRKRPTRSRTRAKVVSLAGRLLALVSLRTIITPTQ